MQHHFHHCHHATLIIPATMQHHLSPLPPCNTTFHHCHHPTLITTATMQHHLSPLPPCNTTFHRCHHSALITTAPACTTYYHSSRTKWYGEIGMNKMVHTQNGIG